MRILLGVHALAPTSQGGTEQAVWLLAHHLAERHHVLLFYPHSLGLFPEGTEERHHWHGAAGGSLTLLGRTLERRAGFSESFASPAAERWFKSLLLAHRPDVVHLHHLSGLSFRLPLLAREAGIPVVLTIHDAFWSCARGQRLNLKLERCAGPTPEGCATCMADQLVLEPEGASRGIGRMAHRLLRSGLTRLAHSAAAPALRARLDPLVEAYTRWQTSGRSVSSPSITARAIMVERTRLGLDALQACDRVLVPSEFHRAQLLLAGLEAERCLHMPNCLRHSALSTAPPVERHSDMPMRVGFIGAMIPSKGPQILLEALALARTRASETGSRAPRAAWRELQGILVGPSVLFHRQPHFGQTLAQRANGLDVTMLPACSSAEIDRLLQTLDVLVVPSIWDENAPTVILEAFQQGVPVVASRVGGIPEQVKDGENGLLVPPGDPEALCEVLVRLAQAEALRCHLAFGAWQEGQRRSAPEAHGSASASSPSKSPAELHAALYASLQA